jgi:protein phosphatase 1L
VFITLLGHGGIRAAEYVKKNLFSNLISHPKFISDTKSAICMFSPTCHNTVLMFCDLLNPHHNSCFSTADAYNHTDNEYLKSENNHHKDAGSTASTAILVGDRLLVANVGDSRAVICRGGTGKSTILICVYIVLFTFLDARC